MPGALAAVGLLGSGLALELSAQPASSEAPDAAQLIERLRAIQGAIEAEPRGAQQGRAAPDESGATANPQLSEAQVRERLQTELGVDVLAIEPVARDGRPAYEVRVMNPPGDYNAAFLVTTLLVDGDSGEILGEDRATPGPARPDVMPGARRPASDGSGLDIRRRTYR